MSAQHIPEPAMPLRLDQPMSYFDANGTPTEEYNALPQVARDQLFFAVLNQNRLLQGATHSPSNSATIPPTTSPAPNTSAPETSATKQFNRMMRTLTAALVKYDGQRDVSALQAYKRALETLFSYAGNVMSAHDRLLMATSHLTGPARFWWNEHQLSDFVDWPDFLTALNREFYPVDAIQRARDRLARLRQTGSVREYQDQFRQLVTQIPDYSESEKKDRFLRGLKADVQLQVQMALTLYGGEHSFATIAELASKADTVLFYGRQARTTPTARTFVDRATHNRYENGPSPMDVDSVTVGTRGQPLTPGQRTFLMRNNGCFYCRKTNAGHLARDCPERRQTGPTNRRVQANVTEADIIDNIVSGNEIPQQ